MITPSSPEITIPGHELPSSTASPMVASTPPRSCTSGGNGGGSARICSIRWTASRGSSPRRDWVTTSSRASIWCSRSWTLPVATAPVRSPDPLRAEITSTVGIARISTSGRPCARAIWRSSDCTSLTSKPASINASPAVDISSSTSSSAAGRSGSRVCSPDRRRRPRHSVSSRSSRPTRTKTTKAMIAEVRETVSVVLAGGVAGTVITGVGVGLRLGVGGRRRSADRRGRCGRR